MFLKGKQYPGPSRSADGEYESSKENRLFYCFHNITKWKLQKYE